MDAKAIQSALPNASVANYIHDLIKARGISISEAARQAEVDKGSLFSVLEGRLALSRNMAVRLGIIFHLDPPTLLYTMYAEERAKDALARLPSSTLKRLTSR